ncbi:MAG: hypothetical protein WCF85_06765 [Rhodospirillaceae bacterium]
MVPRPVHILLPVLVLSFYMDIASRMLRVLTCDIKPKRGRKLTGALTGDACVGSVRLVTR